MNFWKISAPIVCIYAAQKLSYTLNKHPFKNSFMKCLHPAYLSSPKTSLLTNSAKYFVATIIFSVMCFGTSYGFLHGFGKAKPINKATNDKSIKNTKFHAIIIACGNYTGNKWPPLETTIADGDSLKKELIDEYDFKSENVVTIYNKDKDAILRGVKDKLTGLTENDNVLIFYSGHGELDRQTGGAYWVPINNEGKLYEYISNFEITEMLRSTKAKHVLVMADANYSGAMRGPAYEDAKDSVAYNATSRQIISSGSAEKVPGVSVFTPAIIEELRLNKEHYYSVIELYNNIFKPVRLESGKTPMLTAIEGIRGSMSYGQFYFRRKI